MSGSAAETEVIAAFDALFATLTDRRDPDAGTRLFTGEHDTDPHSQRET
jgi:hypothetical protein